MHAESSDLGWASVFSAVGYKQLSNALHTVIICSLRRPVFLATNEQHPLELLTNFRPGNMVLLKTVLNSLGSFEMQDFYPVKETKSIVGREVHVYISKENFSFRSPKKH